MRYKLLGKSGLRVSELCLGTMTFGDDWGWGAPKEESRKPLNESAPDPNFRGNHRKNMRRSVEGSLRRLDTDHIDLLWLHMWDGMTPVEEGMRALDDLVRAGTVLYVGISYTPAWVFSQANTLADLRGWSRFVAYQGEYSLASRAPERDILPMTQALNMTFLPWGDRKSVV